MKKIIFTLFLSAPFLLAGEVSVSISEIVVNDYLALVGEFKDVSEEDEVQTIWTIQNPRVKFDDGNALFLANADFTLGQLILVRISNGELTSSLIPEKIGFI